MTDFGDDFLDVIELVLHVGQVHVEDDVPFVVEQSDWWDFLEINTQRIIERLEWEFFVRCFIRGVILDRFSCTNDVQ